MLETLFQYTYSAVIEMLIEEKLDIEDELKMLGYETGKLILISEKFLPEKNINLLLYKITHLLLPRLYKTERTLEKHESDPSAYILIEETPLMSRYISLPADSHSLSVDSFFGGFIESVITASGFKTNVVTYNIPDEENKNKIAYLIKIQS